MKTKNKSTKTTAKAKTATTRTAAKKQAVKKAAKTPVSKSEQKKKFPGYPPYNASDDITNKGKRIDADIEDTTLSNARTEAKIINKSAKITNQSTSIESDEENEISTDPYNITKEDLEAIGSEELEELNMDGGDDEGLKHRVNPVDFAGSDLDIPAEDQDNSESPGSEDEENKNYSIGGDNHNDLEEDQS